MSYVVVIGIVLSLASGVFSAFYGRAAVSSETKSERMAWMCAAMWAFSCAIHTMISVARFYGSAA